MKTAGQEAIERAKKNGRWESAYDSPKDSKVPTICRPRWMRTRERGNFFSRSIRRTATHPVSNSNREESCNSRDEDSAVRGNARKKRKNSRARTSRKTHEVNAEKMSRVAIIGAGLAGSEAAWQCARRGVDVELFEMRPARTTPAHQTADFAELVCSNSLKSDSENTAPWVLKEEMARAGSLLLEIARPVRRPGRTCVGG